MYIYIYIAFKNTLIYIYTYTTLLWPIYTSPLLYLLVSCSALAWLVLEVLYKIIHVYLKRPNIVLIPSTKIAIISLPLVTKSSWHHQYMFQVPLSIILCRWLTLGFADNILTLCIVYLFISITSYHGIQFLPKRMGHLKTRSNFDGLNTLIIKMLSNLKRSLNI